jgi:hypothetical protein
MQPQNTREGRGGLRSPKLHGKSPWYRYYAGYSAGFVSDALDLLEAERKSVVLDPWNGSGTTTAVAFGKGIESIGVDLNPALVVVARARVLSRLLAPSLEPLCRDILVHSRTAAQSDPIADPLASWFDHATVTRLRGVETSIRHVLVGEDAADNGLQLADRVSALAAFYYTALFRTVRTLARSARTSNPTWVKDSVEKPVSASWRTLDRLMLSSCREFGDALVTPAEGEPALRLLVGSSTFLALTSGSVDVVLTSPPYCTRIDYVAATRPELAVLGMSRDEQRALRSRMIGTPTIATELPVRADDWGATALRFIEGVERHTSKASATYYRKHYVQYFAGLRASLDSILTACRPGAHLGLVVQDSHYKELRLDLALVAREMLELRGRAQFTCYEFSGGSMAAINPRARKYRESFAVTESLLVSR